MRSNSLLALVTFLAVGAGCFGAPINVALNKPASGSGDFSGGVPYFCFTGTSAPISTVNDGVFVLDGSCYRDGVVWAGPALDPSQYIDIDFQGDYLISGAIAQVDKNDNYDIYYLGTDSNYHLWWTVPEIFDPGDVIHGLQTHPNPGIQPLPAVTASGVRIVATSGDGYYSISELQIFGVPEPASFVLTALGGLALLAGKRLRRR